MSRFLFVCDTLQADLPSEFVARPYKVIKVKHCQVYPALDGDEYVLHSNLVQGCIDTGSPATQDFVCLCNTPYLVNKVFYISKTIRSLAFWFTTVRGQPVDAAELRFVIELEI